MTPQPPPRTRLEQRTQAAHLSRPDFCRAFHDAGQKIGENLHVSERQADRWLAGPKSSPRPKACRVLEYWFGEPVAVLFGPPELAVEPVAGPSTGRAEEALAAAQAASLYAMTAAQAIDPGVLEQLHADVRTAASAYFSAPPLRQASDLHRLRTLVYTQLDRTRKPQQVAELQLVLAEVAGLESSVHAALGNLAAAEKHALTAATFGGIIDQPSICAWARALQVAALFWAGRAAEAVPIAEAALLTAPRGTARARLKAVHARSLALIGARDETHTMTDQVDDDLDQAGGDLLLDGTGGELGFSRARAQLCASSAYVTLGEGQAAETAATVALELFEAAPKHEQWTAGMIGARIDLGAARTLRGDLAGAEDALAPVFRLAPERRTSALTGRLNRLSRILATRPYRGVEASRICGRIDDFTARSLPRATRPAITAGP